ncbi:interferon regulatory factor 9-like isoform X1 [Colius striatus]|uniref:interferon regulatory factor 9-like isoform X1 n=1 Tax=Colius striatus TaxID=57412 RepID=UPI002B1E7419|nr:interferon regulatory factor 9-like isoform X1 [Colius striatus]
MASRRLRRLRPWLVAQVESGQFAGLAWDDAGRTAIRIPWQHGGKGGARGGAGAALCQAWAEFKGRVRPGDRPDPAGWKTRLRCALNKSPEFQEVPERSRLEGPRPYKVYRLLPAPQQRGGQPPRRRAPEREEEVEVSPAAGGCGGHPQPHSAAAATPSPNEASAKESQPDGGGTALAPPAVAIMVDAQQPLPPAQGDAALGLQLWLEGALAWKGYLPPGDYLLATPVPPGTPLDPPGLLPRLLLLPPPEEAPPELGRLLAGLRPGLLVASAQHGIFLRRRPAGTLAPAGCTIHCNGPHSPGGPLLEGQLVQPFDPQRFQEELSQHRAGLGPLPRHQVTLAVGQELGPDDGPHNRTLVLQFMEQRPHSGHRDRAEFVCYVMYVECRSYLS